MIAVQSLALGLRGHPQCAPGWQLSNLYLRRHFARVEAWCDEPGEIWLRDLGVTFDQWHRLPAIPEAMAAVWSFGKIATAAAQSGPFLHVDGDVFWRQPPPADVPFLVQHAEMEKPAWAWWDRVGFAPIARPERPISYNFGIFGGTAWAPIADACRAALDCLQAHRALVAGVRCGCLPMLAEQVWVPALMAREGVTPTCLLRHDHLQEDAARLGYFHAMSGKKDPEMLARIERRWAQERANGGSSEFPRKVTAKVGVRSKAGSTRRQT